MLRMNDQGTEMLCLHIGRAAGVFAALGLVACGGGGSGGGASPPATASLSASAPNVAADASVTLTWASTNATSCTASGGWTGALAASGAQTVAVAATTTYNISCAGSGAPGTGSTTVTAYSRPVPVISVDPAAILPGSTVTVTWAATQATACTVSGGDLNSSARTGTHTTAALTAAATYTIACTNPVFSTPVSASASVTLMETLSLAVVVAAQVPGDPVRDASNRHYVPDWAHPVSVPVPYVSVLLENASQTVLQSIYADANGIANFTGLDPNGTYTVIVQSKIKTTTVPVLDFAVVNNTGSASTAQGGFRARYGVYTLSAVFAPAAGGGATQTLPLTAPDGWNTSSSSLVAADRVAAPFVLLANAVREAQIVSSATGLANPAWRPLTVLWSVTNKGDLTTPPSNFDQGTVTGSGGFWSSGHSAIAADGTDTGTAFVAEDYIYLSGDPSFELMDVYPFVMSHEMGHFVQSLFSTRVSMGGEHSYTDYEDFENAWIEGSASGIAALVLASPQQRRVVSSSGEVVVSIDDISNNTVNGTPVAGTSAAWPVGWYQESTVTDFIWSAHVSMGLSNADTLSPLFSTAWKAGPYINSVWSYATLLKQQFSSVAGAVDTFSSTHGFVTAGGDEYGRGESNAGNRASRDVLPPYTTLAVGQSVTLCSAGQLLEYNKARQQPLLQARRRWHEPHAARAGPGEHRADPLAPDIDQHEPDCDTGSQCQRHDHGWHLLGGGVWRCRRRVLHRYHRLRRPQSAGRTMLGDQLPVSRT